MEKCLSRNQTQQREKIPTIARNVSSFRSYLADNILRTEIIFKSLSHFIAPGYRAVDAQSLHNRSQGAFF